MRSMSFLSGNALIAELSLSALIWTLSIALTVVPEWRMTMIKYFIIGLLIGAVIGYTMAALMAVSDGGDET